MATAGLPVLPSLGGFMRFGPFLIIALVLFVLWAGGFVVFHTAGFLIHILLILAVISIIAHFFTAARST
jgi:Family of unknown function (DUF5670)